LQIKDFGQVCGKPQHILHMQKNEIYKLYCIVNIKLFKPDLNGSVKNGNHLYFAQIAKDANPANERVNNANHLQKHPKITLSACHSS
jgi:hypothetical protein